MKKIILSIIIFCFYISNAFALKAGSEEEVLAALKKGGNIVFIRHAYAPRINNKFEPDDFYSGSLKKKDCSVQRDLDARGMAQAKIIGAIFKENNIKLHFLCTWWDILEEVKLQKTFTSSTIEEVEKFLHSPRDWQNERL